MIQTPSLRLHGDLKQVPKQTRRVSPLFLSRLNQQWLKAGWKCSCVLCNLSHSLLCLCSFQLSAYSLSVFSSWQHISHFSLAWVAFLICTCSCSLSSPLTGFNPSICIVWCWLTANNTKHFMQFWGLSR